MEEVKYCQKCGAYIPFGAEKCVACGGGESKQRAEPETPIDLDRLYRPFTATMNGRLGRAQVIRGERRVMYMGGRTIDGRLSNETRDYVTLTLDWIEM